MILFNEKNTDINNVLNDDKLQNNTDDKNKALNIKKFDKNMVHKSQILRSSPYVNQVFWVNKSANQVINQNKSKYKMYYMRSLQIYYVFSMVFRFNNQYEESVELINIYLNYAVIFFDQLNRKKPKCIDNMIKYLTNRHTVTSDSLLKVTEAFKQDYDDMFRGIILSLDKLAECYESLVVLTFGNYYLNKICYLFRKESHLPSNDLDIQVLFGHLTHRVESANIVLKIFLQNSHKFPLKNCRISSVIKLIIKENDILEKLNDLYNEIIQMIKYKDVPGFNIGIIEYSLIRIRTVLHLYKYNRYIALLKSIMKITNIPYFSQSYMRTIANNLIILSKRANNEKFCYCCFIL